jgi:hypothetical protein
MTLYVAFADAAGLDKPAPDAVDPPSDMLWVSLAVALGSCGGKAMEPVCKPQFLARF